jgi:gliding motility-associated-like protein
MKKITQHFLLFMAILLLPITTFASHVSGGEIYYTSLGNNQFKVVMALYWDCGSFDPGATANIITLNNCGLPNLNFPLTLDSALEISQVCPTAVTTCNGGTLPGNKKNIYSAIVTLPGACSSWTFHYTSCCRNTSTNVPAQPDFDYYATLNNVAAPNNNSPYFTSGPLPYLCVGQQVCYNPGAVEIDGHTLSFAFVSAMGTSPTTPVAYGGGYTGAVPMPGITINPTTGLILFTPTMAGNFVVSYMCTERDANNVIVGQVIRDIQMVVVNCSNQVVSCNGGNVTNATGTGAVVTNNYTLQICENIPFTFQTQYTDPDPANILSIISNITSVMPGSTITTSGTNPLTVNVSWTAPPGSANSNTLFTITVSDNACPVTGQQTFNYLIDVLPATNAGPDQTICGNQGAQLNGVGPGNTLTWSVVSGPPIVVGTNFSCNPCANPIATPTATTTYLLTSSGANGCLLTDTVTVFVVPDFNYNITQSAANTCLLNPVNLNVANITPAGNYSYSWLPITNLSNANIANPTATFNSPGTYSYTLTLTSAQGCTKTNQITISVLPSVSPNITAHGDTTFCSGNNANLTVTFGSGVPAVSGPSFTGPCAVTTPLQVGTGNITTTYPTPFCGFWNNGRLQMLYRASELNALGFVGGKINSVSFNITAKNSTQPYAGFTIKIGTTALSSLPATGFQNVPTVVYNPTNYSTVLGVNNFIFTTAYEWNGVDNLIFEFCYNNTSWTGNDIISKSTTGFASVLAAWQDPGTGCTLTNVNTGYSQTERPTLTLGTCTVDSNPLNFTYSWTPTSGAIVNPTAQNTIANPTQSTTYTVTVTSINGGCASTDTVRVNIINVAGMYISPAGPYCSASSIDTLQINGVPIGTGAFSGPGITNTTLGIFNPAIAGLGSHTIHYTVTNSQCGNGDTSIVVSVTNTLDPTITAVAPMCTSYNPITLTAASPGGSWHGSGITDTLAGTFNPALANIGNNTITYVIYNPCYSFDTEVIQVTQKLQATINPVGPYCVSNLPVQLTSVNPTGTWFGPGVDPVTGIFSPSVAGPSGPGGHQIFHYISTFCGDTASTFIIVYPNPIATTSANVVSGCQPLNVNFSSTVDQPGGTYQWSLGNGTSSVLMNPSATYTSYNSGIPYTVGLVYTSPLGCRDTVIQTGMITVFSQPEANFSYYPNPANITNPEIHFTPNTSGVIDTWAWDFGDFATATTQSPTHTYADTGHYQVVLVITNSLGPCTYTVTNTVVINPYYVLYIPSAFTPNDNGTNDLFMPQGDGFDIGSYEIRIFNRWGERVYQSADMKEGWNGKHSNSGPVVEQGIYVYKISIRDYKGFPHEYIGNLSVLR